MGIQKLYQQKLIHEKNDINLSHLFQYASIGMAFVGLEGRWLEVNRSLCEMTGYSEEELLSKTFQDITYSEDLATDLFNMRKLLNNKIDHYQIEKRYIRKDGQLLWISLRVSLVKDSDDKPLYFIALIENIDDRKKASLALGESEERWHFALEGSNAAVWDWDLRTNQVFFSKRWKEMLGYKNHEIKHELKEWSSRVHPDDLNQCLQDLENHFLNKTEYYINEHRLRCKNGEYLWILDRGKVMSRDQQGKPLRMIGTHTDITEKKILEEKVNHREGLFQSIFNNPGIGIVVTDEQGKIISSNETFNKLVNSKKNKTKTLNFSDFLMHKSKYQYELLLKNLMLKKITNITMEACLGSKTDEFLTHITATPSLHPHSKKTSIIHVITDITQRKAREQRMVIQAYYDPLTNLPNQFFMMEQLTNLFKNTPPPLSVIYIDIKNLKDVNNLEGRDIGDEVLKLVAKKLEKFISKKDFLARVGDDEFTLIINNNNKQFIEKLISTMLKNIEKTMVIKNTKIKINCYCGIVVVEQKMEPQKLLTLAEIAMQQAKESETKHYEFFKEDYYQERIKATTIKYDILEALKNHHFFNVYQPIIDLKTQKIAKIEALIRWQHPKKGLILPESFIKIARKHKLIIDIDNWVIRNICKQLESFLGKYPLPTVTVNITAAQLLDENFITYITQEINPHIREKICLEILEAEFVEHSEEIMKILNKIKKENLKISIDDFGVGYSSLTDLRDLPIDYLKLDKSLMQHLKTKIDENTKKTNRNLIFLNGVIKLGKELGCIIIAEGVETSIQDYNVKQLGCDHGQGFFYGEFITDLKKFITEHNDSFLH